jgi:hypothetical protein
MMRRTRASLTLARAVGRGRGGSHGDQQHRDAINRPPSSARLPPTAIAERHDHCPSDTVGHCR